MSLVYASQLALLAKKHMSRAFARHMLHRFVPKRGQIDAGEECFSLSEQDRSEREMQLVDEAGAQILPNRRYAAVEPDVLFVLRRSPPISPFLPYTTHAPKPC